MSDARPFAMKTIIATAAAAFLCIVTIVVWNAPANWLAIYLASKTQGVVVLADADGTIWSGSAVLALGSPASASSTGTDQRLALPGRVTWTLEIAHALAPVLHLTHDGVLLQPLAVRYADGGLAFDAGKAIMPASVLQLTGAPLNTLRPEGRCELSWNALQIDREGRPIGDGTLRIGGFALALSPVRPLGDYLVTWRGDAGGLTWQLATEHGPLELQGNGGMVGSRMQARVVVHAAADAPASVVAQLAPLLDMIGRRGPNEAVIETGVRS
jgi:general secretion pathway protein N